MKDITLFYKNYTLKTPITRSRYMIYCMRQSKAFWYLFDSFIKKVDYINIALKHLILKVTIKRLSKKEVLLNYWDRS